MITKKQTLTLLIASTFVSATAYSAENNNSIRDNAFFNDSKMELSVKNLWKYLKEDEQDKKNVHAAWGQGLALNYRSGYLFDTIGFDSTYYGAIALGATDHFGSRGVLYNNKSHPGNNKDNADGYSKFGQRYAKVKFGDETFGGNAYYGWKVLNRFAALSASNRLSQNSYLGFSADTHFQNFTLRGAYVTDSINRDSANTEHFQTADGKKNINQIITGDISYKGSDLKATYFYGVAHDYLERHGLFLNYKLDSNWSLASQIYGTQAMSDWKAMSASNKAFDNSAWHYVGLVSWKDNAWSSNLGAGYTRAEKTAGVGHFPRHLTRNSRGNFSSLTSAGADYMRDGETALFSSVDYQLNEDFSAGLYLNYGQFAYQNHTVRTGEATLFLRWIPQSSALKGLSLRTSVGPGIGYKNKSHRDKTPNTNSGGIQRAHTLGADFILEYKINLF